jgi:hypothetical protein
LSADIKTAKEQKMSYAKKTEQGDILLTPGEFINKDGPSGFRITSVTLSRMGTTIHWFIEFLIEKESVPAEYKSSGRVYRAFRDPDAVFLEDIRDGGHANVVGFSLNEIQTVLDELHQIMAEESAKET